MLRLVIIPIYLGCTIGLLAQADPIAEAIKPNVAEISSSFASGNTEQGFGFVVGESNNKLYLATAGHVVQEEGAEPGKENALSIRIRFCGDFQDLVGRILNSNVRPFDFALLEIDKPLGFVWKADCLGTRPGPGLSVTYIGRDNSCYIPTATSRGTINRVNHDHLLIDINGLKKGTSGAPVIGPQGIIGMITNADIASADALNLERLQDEITLGGQFPKRFGLKQTVDYDLITYNMERINGDYFPMGCIETRDGTCNTDELPDHGVTISSFYLSKYEVTNGEFVQFLNAISPQISFDAKADKISYEGQVIFDLFCDTIKGRCPNFKEQIEYNLAGRPGDRFTVVAGFEKYPVVLVSKYGAEAYCAWLKTKTGKIYRLPTEAEWEFAARGGEKSQKYKYAGANEPDGVAWYESNSSSTAHPVGLKKANELGLYDLSGNVCEWCADWYDRTYYKNSPSTNPKGPNSGTNSVVRGGSWFAIEKVSRVAFRFYDKPDYTDFILGFRVARDL